MTFGYVIKIFNICKFISPRMICSPSVWDMPYVLWWRMHFITLLSHSVRHTLTMTVCSIFRCNVLSFPLCVDLSEHAPCRFWLRSVLILTNFGRSNVQARISNTVRARPVQIWFCAHGPCLSSYGPCHCFHAHILCIYEPVPFLDEFDL